MTSATGCEKIATVGRDGWRTLLASQLLRSGRTDQAAEPDRNREWMRAMDDAGERLSDRIIQGAMR